AAAAEACGRPVELLSGAREARLSALGVMSGFVNPVGLVGDLGGGSLELVEIAGKTVGDALTLRLGGLALRDLSGNSPEKARRLVN
ncbi:Ppx/GppA phosphatase family protein, partial [Vibrio cholerae]|uniref:Ppx/GppA phosphatase family protein n=1 Tax=Vibrio cholerae TaxID=666 RepID=UPI001A20B1CF